MIQPMMPSSSPYEAPNSEFKVLVCDLRFNVSTTIEYIPVFSRSAVLRERVGDDHGISTPSFAAVGDGLRSMDPRRAVALALVAIFDITILRRTPSDDRTQHNAFRKPPGRRACIPAAYSSISSTLRIVLDTSTDQVP